MDDNLEDLPQLVQRRLQEPSKEEPFAADRLGKRPAPHWQRQWPGKRAGTYPAQLDNGEVFWVWFDPLREAQERDGVGIVDRTLGTEEASIAALSALEPPIASILSSHKPVRRVDGRVELWPKAWDTVRLGANGPTISEVMWKRPGLDPADNVLEKSYPKLIKALLRNYRPDFDNLPFEEQLALIEGAAPYVENFQESLRRFVVYLEYGQPNKDLRTALENADRDVRAAVLKDVHGLTAIEIAKRLGANVSESAEDKNYSSTAASWVKNGRIILERAFGEEGWRERVEAAKAAIRRRESIEQRWERLSVKERYIALLAEASDVTEDEAHRVAVAEGFDQELTKWAEALERGDEDEADRAQMSDWRFGLELFEWGGEELEKRLRETSRRWLKEISFS
jgi:hypothetical protein